MNMKYRTSIIYMTIFICFFLSINVFADPVLIDRILAVVDTDIVTLSDLIFKEKRLYGIDASPQKLSADARIRIREKMLQDLIDERLMINEAKSLGLTASEEEIQDQIDQIKIKNNLHSDEALEASLGQDGLTMEDLKRKFYDEITLLKIRAKILSGAILISDQEILEYYDKQWTGHKEEERVTLSHILLKCPEETGLEEEDAILKKSQEIIREWNQGESFPALATKYSEDISASSYGNLGTFYFGDLKPEFAEAIKDLQPGNIAGPIKTEFGYHILFLEERKDSGLEKGSDIWNKIKETIFEKKKADYFETWIEHLRKKANIEVHRDALEWDF